MEAIAAISMPAPSVLGATSAIPATGFLPAVGDAGALAPQGTAAPGGFASMVSNGLEGVNNQLMTSQTDLQKLAMGDAQNLHQIMIRMEESRLSFQLMVQVRNRLLEAYQDVMKMPI